ncbi:MAG: T9SS type A sorting domain-containing protein [Bacteroidales bacterium]|nr:T9SS type A sorting domain-containing protein [Bacteroidales bacterium]
MKKLLILFLLIGSFKAISQTSLYHPFPDSNATWNFDYTQAQCMFGFGFEEYSITLSGDTTINGTSCQKLTVPFVDFSSLGSCSPYNTPGYKGAIREDEQQRKVYFIAPSETTEQLLYDFNLLLGDTIQGVLSTFTFSPAIVESIDSVKIGETYRKSWNINNWYGISIIEGLGSSFGLIQPTPGYITDASTFVLNCFRQDGITLYPDNTIPCGLITSIPIFNNCDDHCKVFPNPSKGSFTIWQESGESLENVFIVNMPGNIVFQRSEIQSPNLTINGITPGIYLLQVVKDKRLQSVQKIIIYP